jgi:Druantia protein DruA
MEVKWRYRGREVTEEDLASIRSLIAEHPSASRWALSKLLCERWNWRQENGELRDMIARSLMLGLGRAGLIELPPARSSPPNNVIRRRRPEPVSIDRTPIRSALSAIQPVELREVRRTPEERVFDGLIEEHHYLGYTRPVGEHLKYMAWAGERPIACIAWSSAPRHLGPRDRFIGWSPEARRRNLRFLAYNTRYLILPWVTVPHLASHILGRMAKLLAKDWERVYGHPVFYLETFVDPARNRGTCYRAANWIFLGRTTGRGNNAPTKKPRVPIKEILGYPLSRRCREILGREP